MLNLNKPLSTLLALCFLISAAGCAAGSSNEGETTVTAAEAETQSDSGYSDFASQYLNFTDPVFSGADYGGASFNILTYEDKEIEGETGDVIEDAEYTSRRSVEEKLNIDISYIKVNSVVDVEPELKKVVIAGDDVYNLAENHCIHALPTIIQEKLVLNWNDIENVDFSQPYWNQSLNDTLSVKGVLPVANGNYFTASPMTIFFNKEIQTVYGVEDLYATVNSGEWTLDRMCTIAKGVSSDLNGDGAFTTEDLYGMIGMADYQYMGFLMGCNQYVVEKDEEDFPTVALDNEKTYNIYNTLYSLIYETDAAFTWKYGTDKSTWVDFAADTSLFYVNGGITEAVDYRSMDTDFGILPFPKYNEEQKDYMSLDLGMFIMVPAIVADPGLSGMASELLNATYRRSVVPEFVDKLLVGKVTRDAESEEMVYMILDNIHYDFGINLGYYTDLSYVLGFTLRERTNDFTSYVASRIDSTNKYFSKVYDYYLGYLE